MVTSTGGSMSAFLPDSRPKACYRIKDSDSPLIEKFPHRKSPTSLIKRIYTYTFFFL